MPCACQWLVFRGVHHGQTPSFRGRLSVSDRVDRRRAFCFPTKDSLTQNGSYRRADTALSSWFTRSSFSVPRITVFNTASSNGRCGAFASFRRGVAYSCPVGQISGLRLVLVKEGSHSMPGQTSSDFVEIAKRNGDFKKNYGTVIGA